jgi:uncharacterized membrane protein
MFKVFLNSALRHAASGIGAAIVAKGIIQPGQESALVEILTGGTIYAATQATSWINAKRNAEKSIY